MLKQAVELLKQGGYTIQGGKMLDASGRQLAFEIMTQNADQEKTRRRLSAIAADASASPSSIRTVDDSQYQSRTNSFDYDMIMKSYHVVAVAWKRTARPLVFGRARPARAATVSRALPIPISTR